MKKIGFRVDTGNIVGSGHLMEIFSIYKNMLDRFSFKPLFITVGNDYIAEKLQQAGIVKESIYYFRKRVSAEELTEEEDIEETAAILRDRECEYLIMDLPNRTDEYYKGMTERLKGSVAILDNDNPTEIAPTLVVNFSITQDADYYARLNNNYKYLIGPRYVPLNENILKHKAKESAEEVETLFINQGGSDPYGLTRMIISALERTEGRFKVDILIGGLLKPKHRTEIKEKVAKSIKHEYQLHENIPQEKVYTLMERADLAISAAGNTLYELAYFGVPSLMIAPRREFLRITKDFSQSVGNIDLGIKDNINENILKEKISELIGKAELRKAIAFKLKKLVDGRGTERICDRIYKVIFCEN